MQRVSAWAGEGSRRLVGFDGGDDIAERHGIEAELAAWLARARPAQLAHRLERREARGCGRRGPRRLAAASTAVGASAPGGGGVAWRVRSKSSARHGAATAPGVVGEVQLADDLRVLGRLVRCEMRDQAPIAEGAELVVDDERAPVRPLGG